MSDLTPCTDANGHCWHDDGELLASNPPVLPQTCCWCGQHRRVTLWIGDPQPQPHGPHAGYRRAPIRWDFAAPNLADGGGGTITETGP